MPEVKITVKKNGPYRVEGPILLVDADGNQYDLTGKPAISLCRCGGSVTKPFCDGTHTRLGFQAAESAVRAEEQRAAADVVPLGANTPPAKPRTEM